LTQLSRTRPRINSHRAVTNSWMKTLRNSPTGSRVYCSALRHLLLPEALTRGARRVLALMRRP
jgi:hypothetical protein